MPGWFGAHVGGLLLGGISPGLVSVLLAAPLKKLARAQPKKIYVLNEMGDMTAEYVLDPDCPIDYNDFLKVLPDEGIGDRETLFVGEYVFTALQSGKTVFVILSRGQLAPEDLEWTALLLTAAAARRTEAPRLPPTKPTEAKPSPDAEKALADREARAEAKEKELSTTEARLGAEAANLKGRTDELARQEDRLTALADYVSQLQQGVTSGVARAHQSLEMAESIAASTRTESNQEDAAALADARHQFDDERKALLLAKQELETKYREAQDRLKDLEDKTAQALGNLERERAERTAREAEQEKTRVAIEARVQELSQRFAQMAKERLMLSHQPSPASPAERSEVESAKAELQKERKFLQRRAIEMLDREERVRDRETRVTELEAVLAKREEELKARAADLERTKATLPAAGSGPTPPDVEQARQDLDLRVRLIQQKAKELLDREQRLRKRAEELQALEARLSGKVPVE